jgi:hypothetical protein
MSGRRNLTTAEVQSAPCKVQGASGGVHVAREI